MFSSYHISALLTMNYYLYIMIIYKGMYYFYSYYFYPSPNLNIIITNYNCAIIADNDLINYTVITCPVIIKHISLNYVKSKSFPIKLSHERLWNTSA